MFLDFLQRQATSRPRSAAGFSLVWVLVLIGGMAAVALALAPTFRAQARQTALAEDAMLDKLAQGLKESILSTRTIPGANTWAQAVAQASGMNLTTVRQVFPQFASETTSRRIYLIDPRFQPTLGGAILPLSQPAVGFDPSVPAQVPNGYARVILVSSTKRGLNLPMPSGVVSQTVFDGLWDWAPTPSSPNPPAAAGFGAAWQGNAAHLHVAKINLEDIFSFFSFRSLSFTLDGGPVVSASSAGLSRYLVQGTRLDLFAPSNGARVQRHVVVKADRHFDFRYPLQPIGFWSFGEGVGATVSTNLGTAGTLANSVLTAGSSVSNSSLTLPPYPGFATTNTSLELNGISGFADTTRTLLNGLNEFSLACWVYPLSFPTVTPTGFCGQQDVAAVGFTSGHNLTLSTAQGGQISIAYPFPAGEWHHITATGDGQRLRIFIDGTIRAAGGVCLSRTDYGSSAHSFRIGGSGLMDGGGNYFHGLIDNVCLFDRSLTAAQITQLMQNKGPSGL